MPTAWALHSGAFDLRAIAGLGTAPFSDVIARSEAATASKRATAAAAASKRAAAAAAAATAGGSGGGGGAGSEGSSGADGEGSGGSSDSDIGGGGDSDGVAARGYGAGVDWDDPANIPAYAEVGARAGST